MVYDRCRTWLFYSGPDLYKIGYTDILLREYRRGKERK